MARPSDVELTPGRETAQAQGRRATSRTESRDAGETQTGSPLKGIFGNIASRIFGRPAQPTAQEADETENAEDMEVDTPIQEGEGPGAASPIPKSRSSVPEVQIPSRTRPARRDIYKGPSSSHSSDEEDEIRVNSPRKRTKITIKPKKAIKAPRGDKRYSSTISALPSNTESTSRLEEPAALPLSSRAEVEQRGLKEPPAPVKRGRGRPPKHRPKEPNPTPRNPVRKEVSPTPAGAPVPEEVPPMDEGVATQEDSEDINEILMNPSPVKPISIKHTPQINRITTNGGGKQSKHPASEKQSNSVNRKSDDSEDGDFQAEHSEDEDEDEDEDAQDDRGDQDSQENNKPDQQTSNLLFEVGLLANMVTVASRVGHRLNKETGKYDFVTNEKMMSANGKQIIRPINKLLSAYEELRIANSSGDIEAAKEAKTASRRIVQDLKLETKSILTKRLGNPGLGIGFFGEIKTRTMLQDLYFNIIPALVKVIKVAVDVYPPERSMKTFAVRQTLELVTMLEDLAKTAKLQPEAYQPRPPSKSKSKTYQIRMPTQLLMPDIRTIRKELSAELAKRKLADNVAAHHQKLSELKKREREEEQGRDAELEARLRDRRREQAQAFRELVAEPLWGRLLVDQVTETEGNSTRRRDQFSMNNNVRANGSRSVEHVEEDQDDYDPFAEEDDGSDHVEDDVDRISVFGRNNKNDRSRPLSSKEKEIFVECMIKEREKDRYEKAAHALDRSMDEIFSYAKDLQEAMDRKHAEGLFNEAKDGWTYDVWVTKA